MEEGHLFLKNNVCLWLQGNICVSSRGIAFPDYIWFCLTSLMATRWSSMCWIALLLRSEPARLQYWLSRVLPPDVPEVRYHWQSRTEESSPERHGPDEEGFSKSLKTFAHEVTEEIFGNACLQPGHRYYLKVYSHASQPICLRASACCWRGLQTLLISNQFTTSEFPEYSSNDQSQMLPQIQVALFCDRPDTYRLLTLSKKTYFSLAAHTRDPLQFPHRSAPCFRI